MSMDLISKNRKEYNSLKRKRECTKFLYCLLVAVCSFGGINLSKYHEFIYPHDSYAVRLMASVLIVLAISIGIYVLSGMVKVNSLSLKIGETFSVGIFFVIVFFLNLILLIGYYPGTQSWDTYNQLIDFYDGVSTKAYPVDGGMMITAVLNDHHPIVTTLIFGLFSRIGKLVGSERFGVFLYSVIQIALYSYGYSRVLHYYKSRISASASWGTAIFYLINPCLPFYAMTMLKDSLFSGLFLLYYLLFLKMYNEDIEKNEYLKFVLISLALPWMKKTGIYVVLISNIILLISQIKGKTEAKVAIFTSIAVPATLFFVICPRIVFPIFDIYPGGKQELLGTLFQQSARVGIEFQDVYSEDEKALLNKVFDYDSVESIYDFEKTDAIKNTFKLETVTNDDLREYYKLWIKTGIKHPLAYFRATADTCAGYFAPVTQMYVYRDNHTYEFTDVKILVLIRKVSGIIYDFFENFPGFNILMYLVVYTWWIPLWATYQLVFKRGLWKTLGLLVPVYVSIMTLVVSPYSFGRYAVPLIIITPVIVCEVICNRVPESEDC